MSNKNIDKYLNEEFEKDSNELVPQEETTDIAVIKPSKKKNKKVIAAIITGVIIVVTSVTSLFMGLRKKNKTAETSGDLKNNNSITNEIDTLGMDELGIELEFAENDKKEYGNTTGNVDINSIVEDSNGTIWASKEAKDKSKDIGKVTVDTKGGSLVVKDNGKVYDKNQGYEVKDKNGNTIASGNGSVPEGYAWDSKRNEYVKKEEVGKFVYCDTNFYTTDGTLVFSKGDLVKVETYNNAKKQYLTTKPSTNTTKPSTNNTTSTNKPNGSTNSNGTYTDSVGNVWASKSDHDKGISDPDGVYIKDGLFHYKAKTTTNTTKPSTNTNTSKPSESTSNNTTSKPSTNTNTSNSTYKDEFGNVWASKSDHDKGMNNPDGIYESGGVLHYDANHKQKALTK